MVALALLWNVLLVALSSSPSSLKPSSLSSQSRRITESHPKKTIQPYVRMDHLLLNQLKHHDGGAVWVDVENVRGKSGFALDHWTALEQTVVWSTYHDLQEHVIFVVDHGSIPAGYYVEHQQLTVVFAGPHESADDVIAAGVSHFDKSIVITADNELQTRCQRNAQDVHIMAPDRFLDDLNHASTEMGVTYHDNPENDAEETRDLSLSEQVALGQLDDEIQLRGKLLDVKLQIERKKTMTHKRRKKLKAKADALQDRLARRGPSLLAQVVERNEDDDDGTSMAGISTIDPYEQDLILSRWQEIRNRPNNRRREQTGDRVVLAENFRRRLLENKPVQTLFDNVSSDKDESEQPKLQPSQLFCQIRNGGLDSPTHDDRGGAPRTGDISRTGPMLTKKQTRALTMAQMMEAAGIAFPEKTTLELIQEQNSNNETGVIPALDTLKVVAISDTHGFQSQLMNAETQSEQLPDGDILLHLGDFALDDKSSKEDFQGLKEFDLWLAKQPHKYKIVVRGNHDPWTCHFRMSGALYVTKPKTVDIDGFKIACVPYGSARQLSASGQLPEGCDIFATHLPPYKCLDRTLRESHAGSSFLSRLVKSMDDHTPKLWLCGHIHESRGVEKKKFGYLETTVVNAATANAGYAEKLVHGAAVLQVKQKERDIDVIEMRGHKPMETSLEQALSSTKHTNGVAEDDESNNHRVQTPNELLVAVDLGLKSGVALYNNQGALVRYEQFRFDKDTMQEQAMRVIQSWEDDLNDVGSDDQIIIDPWKVTHVAVEGAGGFMLDAWKEATPGLSIVRVPPNEWRVDILSKKEKKTGADSKAACRLIARQLVDDFGVMDQHVGRFPTDVAEAVVIGTYVSEKLGWIRREPLIRRYQNGNIVVPKPLPKK